MARAGAAARYGRGAMPCASACLPGRPPKAMWTRVWKRCCGWPGRRGRWLGGACPADSRSADGCPDQRRQSGTPAGFETFARCLGHLFPANLAPIDRESGLNTQLTNKLSLGSAVSLPERMNRIDLSQVEPGAPGERLHVRSPETLLSGQLLKDRLNGRLNEGCDGKQRAALRNIDPAGLACPGVDILKDVPVDSFEVRYVKTPLQRSGVKLDQPRHRRVSLEIR